MPHHGGGFVPWTKRRLFRSREFTGPLTAVADDHAPVACSSIGCVLGDQGLVRFGWGGERG